MGVENARRGMRCKRVNFARPVPMGCGTGVRAGRVSRSAPPSDDSARRDALRRRHGGALARYATDLFDGDAARASAALDEAWPHLAELRGENDAEPSAEQLFCAARRQVLAAQRGAGAMQRLDDDGERAAEAGPERGESEEDTVARVFARLTPKQQEALRLKFAHGFRHTQVGGILGLPATHAAQLIHNALSRIVRVLAVRRGAEPAAGPDDPRLTLAALDELAPEENTALAALLPDAAARTARVDELRATARLVAAVVTRRKRRRDRPASRGRLRLLLWAAPGGMVLVAGAWWWMQREGTATPGPSADNAAHGPARVAVRRDDNLPATGSRPLAASPSGTGEAFAEQAEPRRSRSTAAPTGAAAGAAAVGAERTAAASPVSAGPRPEPMNSRELNHAPAPPPASAGASRGRLGPVGHGEPAAEKRGSFGAVNSAAPAATPRGVMEAARPTASTGSGEGGSADVKPEDAAPPSNPVDIAPILALRRALGAARWPQPEEVDEAALRSHFAAATRESGGSELFRARVESAQLPWTEGGRLVRAAATAGGRARETRAPADVVLLLDVSASMDAPNRLPLVQEAVGALVGWLQPGDRVGLVTYAGEAQVLFPLAEHAELERLRAAVATLEAKGRTNGGAGLQQAYAVTAADPGGVRQPVVILCTDGEFNMGQTSEAELGALVDAQRARGVRLAIFGFGRNGAIDPRLEALAARAQGGSGYVNTRTEALAVLGRQLDPLFVPVAREVRLGLGWERVEAAEMYPGETVEIFAEEEAAGGGVLQYRMADGAWTQRDLETVRAAAADFASASVEFRFAALVREFAAVLRAGPAAAGRLAELEHWAQTALPDDAGGYRRELLALLAQARAAAGR